MIILILMVVNSVIGSDPDIIVTANMTRTTPGYTIECHPTEKPHAIEFLTDDRSECAITTSKGNCSYFDFEHSKLGTVIFISDRNPSEDQKFGCLMLFEDTDAILEVYCSVIFNGTDFVERPKQITRFKRTKEDKLVIIYVAVPLIVFVIETGLLYLVVRRRILNRESTQTSETTQSFNALLQNEPKM